MKKYYIYKTTNKITNMQYIGSHHGSVNDSYFGSGLAISRAIEKYGKHNFKKEIIEIVDNKDLLLEREKYWLKKFNCATNPKYYNLTNVAGGGFMSDGKTDEERKIIREKQEVGRRAKRKQTIKKMLQTKQNWTEEQKINYGKSISDALNNLPAWKKEQLGKKRGEASKLRFKNMSKKEKEQLRLKMKNIRRKLKITEEHKAKTSSTMKLHYEQLSKKEKEARAKHMGDIIRGKKWCNNGVKNFRKTPEQIKELGYTFGRL